MALSRLSGASRYFRPKPPSLEIGERLNDGGFSVVHLGRLEGKEVAVKRLYRHWDDTALQGFRSECDLLERVEHPHVVGFKGAFYDKTTNEPILVMERMTENLQQYLERNRGQLSRHKQLEICIQIARGLHFLHMRSPPIVHRDLTDKNILLDADGVVKIGDLGQSKLKTAEYFTTSLPGQVSFMPPEAAVAGNSHYNEKLDIFSLGVLMLEIATQQPPRRDLTGIGIIQEFVRRREDLSKLEEDHPLQPLIVSCLNDNPKDRPNIIAVHTQLLAMVDGDKLATEAKTLVQSVGAELPPVVESASKSSTAIMISSGAVTNTERTSGEMFKQAQEVLKEYRKQFINHVEADVVASDLRFSGIIPQGCHAQILQTFDRIRRNEILHDQMATSCTREALIVASNIFIGKEGYPQIKALGVAMKKSLETGASMGEQPRIASLEDEVKKVSSREEEKKVAAEHSPSTGALVPSKRSPLASTTQPHKKRHEKPSIGAPVASSAKHSQLAPTTQPHKKQPHDQSLVPSQLTRGAMAVTRGNHPQAVAISPVVEAAKHGQLSTMRKLLDGGVGSAEDQDEEGNTALLWASYFGHLPVVRELVDVCKVNVFHKDKTGRNAMHTAAEGGQLEVIKFLSQTFATMVHERDSGGYTMLHWAAQKGHCEVARYLIEEVKMDPQDRDKFGTTALLQAAFGGNIALVRMLLEEFNSSLDEVTNNGRNAMHTAAEGGQLQVIKFLSKTFPTRVHERDSNDFTMLHWAAEKGHCEAARYLIEEVKMDPQDRDKDGDTPLLIAARMGSVEVVRMLLEEFNSSLDEVNNDGLNAMHRAAEGGQLQVIKFLSKMFPTRVHERDSNDFTMLHWAAEKGHCEAARYLIEEVKMDPQDRDKVMEDIPLPLPSAVVKQTRDEICLQQLCYMGTGIQQLLIGPDGGTFTLGRGDASLEFPQRAVDKELSVRYAIILHGPFVFPVGFKPGSVVVYLNLDGATLVKPVNLLLSHWCVRDEEDDGKTLKFVHAPHTLEAGQEMYTFDELEKETDFTTHTNMGVLTIREPHCLFCVEMRKAKMARYSAIPFSRYYSSIRTRQFRIQFMCDSLQWNEKMTSTLQEEKWEKTSGKISRFQYAGDQGKLTVSPQEQSGPGWKAVADGEGDIREQTFLLPMEMSKAKLHGEVTSGRFPPFFHYLIVFLYPKGKEVERDVMKVNVHGADVRLSFSCIIEQEMTATPPAFPAFPEPVTGASTSPSLMERAPLNTTGTTPPVSPASSEPVSDAAAKATPFTTRDIIKALKHQLDARWKHFGMFLGVEDSLTEAIGTGGKPEDCMQQLVSKWVSKETGTGNHPRTWQTVVEAVKDTGAGALAEDLAHEHGVHLSS